MRYFDTGSQGNECFSELLRTELDVAVPLLVTLVQGIVVSGFSIVLATWCLRARGPLFVSAFNPLLLVIVAFAASLILEEKLHLGR